MEELLNKLKERNVFIYVDKSDLKVKFNGTALPEDLLKELRENKPSLVQYLIAQKRKNNQNRGISPAPASLNYPLSSSQHRLWILSQFEDGNIAYNMPGVFVFKGNLNKEAFAFAFDFLIDRHESLRTIFKQDENGEARQFIIPLKEIGFKIKFNDLRSSTHTEATVRTLIAEEFIAPLDITKGPLVRATVFQLPEDKWVFAYTLHHIISDGWSMGILMKELFTVYNAQVSGHNIDILPLRIQYKDYAVWQKALLTDDSFQQLKSYWISQFIDDIPVLELPADRPRPLLKTYNGSIVKRILEPALVYRLQSFAQKSGGTLFMGLISVINVLLHKYTGQHDIIIGSPIAGRDHIDLEDQIGFYVNTLALRSRFSKDDTFKDVFGIVKQTTLQAYEHQAYPFDELVDAVARQRDMSRNPLFDVMVVLQNTNVNHRRSSHDQQNLTDIEVSGYEHTERVVSLFDLRFDFKEAENGLHTLIEFNTDIYDSWRIEQLAENLAQLVSAALDSPAVPISQLEFLSEKERNKILVQFNDTRADYPDDKTLVDLFEEQVEKSPDRTALRYNKSASTFSQLNEKINKLANFLLDTIKLPLESRVGILQSRNESLVISMLGILKAGGAYVPLDGDYPEDRLLHMIENAGIDVLLTEKKFIELANRLQWRTRQLKYLVGVDTDTIYQEEGIGENALMSKDLWDSVGDTAHDDIAAGGWMSSYTGQYFTAQEMEEYSRNIFTKLAPYVNKNMRVLEIGCSSGLTMFQLAPCVAEYHGTDISSSILERTRQEVEKRGLKNVKLTCLPAHDLDKLSEGNFDLVIVNSVIHCFNGHNYLRNVLLATMRKMIDKGLLFLGDVMDEDKRNDLISDFISFRKDNPDKSIRTKTDWSKELFVSRSFLTDFALDHPTIRDVHFSDKIHTISNELTKYRYDAVLTIDKRHDTQIQTGQRVKHQFDLRAINSSRTSNPGITIPNTSLAYVIYTSGSTGKPKGCMLEHKGVVNRIEWMWKHYKFTAADVILQKTTFTFDVSVWEFFLPLCWGAKMVMCEKEDIASPGRILDLIEKEKVTCLHFVPSMLNAFMGALFPKPDIAQTLQSLRMVITSGEALALNTVKDWYAKVQIPIYNLYGPTEASIDVTYYDTSGKDIKIPIGKPIWNTRIYILGTNDCVVPVGVSGEICLAGDGLARGYLQQPELTAQKFISNPFNPGKKLYRTGDLGRWLPDGNIEFLGRKDEQVKIRGYRIELPEIEVALKKYQSVEFVIVNAIPNKEGEKELVAYLKGTATVSTSDLRTYLSGMLPAYMIPNHFVQLDTIPLTSSGKVDKNKLPNPYQSGMGTGTQYLAPTNAIESKLCKLFEDVLNKQPIGILDDFFELGGDSFKAIRVASKFGKGISILDIYKYPAIKSLASNFTNNISQGLVQELTNTGGHEKISILIVPYGAGEPFAYRNLANEISLVNKECAIYCVSLPRTELPHDVNLFTTLEAVVSEIMKEINEKIKTPIILYGKCIGAGITMELARHLEIEKAALKAVCIGGAMATLKIPPPEKIFVNALARINYLKRIGATVPEHEEDRVLFIRNVHWDIAVGVTSFNNWIRNTKSNAFTRLSTPLYCIVGTKDPTTGNFRRRYKDWEFYAEQVSLITIENAGHYLSRDTPVILASILNKITLGLQEDLISRKPYGIGGRVRSFIKSVSKNIVTRHTVS
jgi:amino acid adenylation domain-containing protein